jgi:hypothetical protein
MIGVLSKHTMVIWIPPCRDRVFINIFYCNGRYKSVTYNKSGRKILPLLLMMNTVKNGIDPPGSVQRLKQISAEQEKQDQVEGNAENTGAAPIMMTTIQPRMPRKPS